MKKFVIPCLLAWMGVCSLHAQTLTLPTKKSGKTVETTVKTEKEAPVIQQQKTQKAQDGTLKLPTVKKTETTEATQNVPVVTVPSDQAVAGIPVMPVVKRQTAPRAKPIVKRPKPEDNEIYESAEHMPTYPGGAAELVKFIGEKMQYPQEALADSVQGIVQVSFIVEKDGSTTEFEVLDEHHPALEAEAVRVLQQMPKWKPATQKGVKVRVEYVVPVKFTLPNQ